MVSEFLTGAKFLFTHSTYLIITYAMQLTQSFIIRLRA